MCRYPGGRIRCGACCLLGACSSAQRWRCWQATTWSTAMTHSARWVRMRHHAHKAHHSQHAGRRCTAVDAALAKAPRVAARAVLGGAAGRPFPRGSHGGDGHGRLQAAVHGATTWRFGAVRRPCSPRSLWSLWSPYLVASRTWPTMQITPRAQGVVHAGCAGHGGRRLTAAACPADVDPTGHPATRGG